MNFNDAMQSVQKNKEDQNSGTFGDIVDLAQQGALQTLSGVAKFTGADKTADSLDQWANEQYETLTPPMKTAMAKNLINTDLSVGEGAKDWRTWLGTASNVLGGMAVTMLPGGMAAKGLSIAGKGEAALNILGKSVSASEATNVGTNALLNLAAGNGGQGLNVQHDIENTSYDDLLDSPKFKQYVMEESDNGVSNEEALNNARQRIAIESGNAVKNDFTLGAVNLIAETVGDQAFGKLLKGSIGKTIKGAVGKGLLNEGSTEAIQGGAEQYRSNAQENNVMGTHRDESKGVAAAALESGLVGGVMGAGGGFPGGVAGRMRRRSFESGIEKAITPETINQLRAHGKADHEIESILKSKIENKALSAGFDANEAAALAQQAVGAAFGVNKSAETRHAEEDAADTAANARPDGYENRDQVVKEAREQRNNQEDWSVQNGYPDPRDFGLTQEDAELIVNQPVELFDSNGHFLKNAPKEMKQAFKTAMSRKGAQDYLDTIFNNIQKPSTETINDASIQPNNATNQPNEATNDSKTQLDESIRKGELGFADAAAQQDENFKNGLQAAIKISPAAVLQISQARKNGTMSQEQAISGLQRVINSVEKNTPDTLQPSQEETALRDQLAQEQNSQQQLENRGVRSNGYQPNVEDTDEFKTHQARRTNNANSSFTNASSQPNANPEERDITPGTAASEDQVDENAPRVDFDRWSDVQNGDSNRDERYSSDANEYELNPENSSNQEYREPNIVAQEPVVVPEQRQPKLNARQQKKADKKRQEQDAELERNKPVVDDNIVHSTSDVDQPSQISEQLKQALSTDDEAPAEPSQPEVENKKEEIQTSKKPDNKIIHQGITLDLPVISQDIEDGYNRSTHIGKGRDFNKEIETSSRAILDDLADKNLLDTPERKQKAKELIEDHQNQVADFIRWESNHSQNNPSWLVTGRSNRKVKNNQSANDKHMNEYSKRVDRLVDSTKSIPERVKSVMNDEQKAKHSSDNKESKLKDLEKNIIGFLVRDIFNYMSDGKPLVAKDNRKWALKKAQKSLDTLLDSDKKRAIKLLKSIDKSARTESKSKWGIMAIVGGKRSSIGKQIDQLLNEPESDTTEQIDKAAEETNTNPSQAQIEAGNYKKGRLNIHGLNIAVENPKDSTRTGTDSDGKSWSVKMHNHYGYIESTKGADGDEVDVFIGPKENSKTVYVINQNNPNDGKFDEHKVMLNFRNRLVAKKAYLNNYNEGWKGFGDMTAVPFDEFKQWLKTGDLTKPFSRETPEPTPPNTTSDTKSENTQKEPTPKTQAKSKGRARPSSPRAFIDAISDAQDGKYTKHESIELIEHFIAAKNDLTDTFNGKTISAINKIMGAYFQASHKGMRKESIVKSAVREIGQQFSFLTTDQSMTALKSPEEMKSILESMSDSDFEDIRSKRQAKREEKLLEVERKKKALSDPKTLDDYQRYASINGGGINAFTDEQLAEFDRLYVEHKLEVQAEKDKREQESKSKVTAVESNGDLQLAKIDSFNDKKNENRYGVSFGEISTEQYQLLKSKAKQLGGWYARKWNDLPARFDFKDQKAQSDFLSVLGGMDIDQSDRVQAKSESKSQTKQEHQIEKLREKANALQAKADESNSSSRLTNTSKRAAQAASAAAKADKQESQANILNAISNGLESGKFKLLGNLTDISQLEELGKLVNRVKWDIPKELRDKFTDMDRTGNLFLKSGISFNDIARYVKFPAPQSTPSALEYIAGEIEDLKGYKQIAKTIRSNIKGTSSNERINLNGNRWDKVIDKLRTLARSDSGIYRLEHINELFKTQDRLTRMGINGDISLREALREYQIANDGKITTRKEKTRLQELTENVEDIIRGNRNAYNNFFPTPTDEVQHLIDIADIQPGMKVLEPNAGMGHIADEIAQLYGVDLDVGEIAHSLREILNEKGHNVVSDDFLDYNPGEIYDRVVMNPPFSNDQDITHIYHALTMLKPGGKLVAITSSMAGERGNNTNKSFKRYLEEVGAEQTDMKDGAFESSLNPTSVSTKIIELTKPVDDIDFDNIRFSQTSEVQNKPTTSMNSNDVTDSAQRWLNEYDGLKGANVTVVQTMDDLYDLVDTESNAIVKGAWLAGDNRVVLVADNLRNEQEVRQTLRHEFIAHNGLYGNLNPDEQSSLTKKINSLRNNKHLENIFSEVDKSYKSAPDNVKAEEVIAKIAEVESGPIRKLADKFLASVMGALRRSGLISNEKVTISEIRNMINNVDSDLRTSTGKTTLGNAVRFSQTINEMSDEELNKSDPTMSVVDALLQDNDKFHQQMLGKLNNSFIGKTFDSLKNGGWSLLNLRQMAEVGRRRVGNEVGSILDSYVANKDLFTTRKSELIEKVHSQAEKLNAFRRDTPEEAEKTFSLLHDATLLDVDPSIEYVDRVGELKKIEKNLSALYMEYGGSNNDRAKEIFAELKSTRKDIKNEPHRKLKHSQLRDKFNKLSENSKNHFTDVRDHYISQRNEMDKALEERVADLAMAGSKKAGDNTYHRIMMEKARLGFYVPLARFGQYWVSVQDPEGERSFQMYETEADMMQDVNKLKKAGYGDDLLKWGTKLNQSRGMNGASASFITDIVKAVSGAHVNTDAKEKLTDEIYQMYLSTMPDRSIRRSFIHRKGIAGFSEDAARVLADQGVKQANQQARLETEKKFSDLMDTLKTATESSNNVSAGRLFNEMLQRHEWMMNPQRAKWAQSLTGFGFFWQIGISPASALINLTQNWQVALPVIGSKYGFKDTAAEMGKLSTLFVKTFAAKKKSVGFRGAIDVTNGILGDVVSDEERDALRHAIKIGAIDVTQMADLSGMAEQSSQNYTGKMAKAQQFIGAPFHWAEVMNREVTFLSAYRMAKKNNLSKNDALDYASKATWDSHFDYSSRNRARFMHGDVAAVALQFKQYSQNMTYFLFRNFFDALKGQTPEIKTESRRQLLATFGVTFAIGGLNALPIATLAAIANMAYAVAGDDDEPWDAETELKSALSDMVGDDLAKPLYYGTMPSISSRINIDLLRMWVQESDSQDATDWLENISQQALGASFGTAMSFARGAQYFTEGQYLRAGESVTPKWIKDILRTTRYISEGGNITNRHGEILIGDLGPLEYAGQALGFTPSRLAQQYDMNSAMMKYQSESMRRRQSLMNAYWLAIRTDDKSGIEKIQHKVQLFNRSDWGKASPITGDVLRKSIKTHRRLMQKSVNGAHFNKKYMQILNEQQYW